MRGGLSLAPDPSQAPVLEHQRGGLLVTGPPGSGKTAVLRERFARLLEGGVHPERVGLLVLSRRAAREGREAIVRRLARSLPDVPVFTVHGFAFRVLGRRFPDLGYDQPPQVLSAPEQYAVVRELLAGERAEDWPTFGHLLTVRGFAQQVADFLLRAQERLLSPEELAGIAERSDRPGYGELAAFYGRYADAQMAAGRTDFAGLLFQASALLRRDLSAEEALSHVMVDDYQDVTQATEGILGALAPAADSVVVAADPAGHVFAYRGGSREPLDRIERTVPGPRRGGGAAGARGGRRGARPPRERKRLSRARKQNLRTVSTASDMRSGLLGRLEADGGGTHPDLVAVLEALLTDGDTVHRGAVHAAQVGDDETVARGSHLGMTTGGLRVREGHGAIREPADRGGLVPELDPASVRQYQRPEVRRLALDDLGHDLELAGAELVVLDQRHGDGPHERVRLVPGVLAGGVGELALEHVGVAGEAFEVVRGEVDDDVVGHHGPAPHADHAPGVERACDLPPDLDGLEAGPESLGERPLDEPLEPPLEALEPHRAAV
jgi:hypothetical protein